METHFEFTRLSSVKLARKYPAALNIALLLPLHFSANAFTSSCPSTLFSKPSSLFCTASKPTCAIKLSSLPELMRSLQAL